MVLDAYGRQTNPAIGLSVRFMAHYAAAEAERMALFAAEERVHALRRSVLGDDEMAGYRIGATIRVRLPQRFEGQG